MSRKRLSKKQLRRDKFVEQTFDWAHWAETHKGQVVGGLVVVALLVAGFFVYRGMSRSAEAQASEDYLRARQALSVGNYPLAASDLQSFVSRHGGSRYADDARFFTALAHYRAGQYGEAIRTLEEFLDRHGDSPFADNARWMLAAAHQEAGQFDRAVAAYREAIAEADYDAQKARLHEALAAVYAAQGRTEEAAEQYRAIIDLEPEGPAADRARRDLAEVTVEPLGAAGEPSTPAEVSAASPAESVPDTTTAPAVAGSSP